MDENQNTKKYDLEERTFIFANRIKEYIKTLPKNLSNTEYCKQLVRSSGSVGANYIEANESLSKKDFVMRVKICRKEAKESCYWLRLIETNNDVEKAVLIQEAIELTRICGAIVEKSKILKS